MIINALLQVFFCQSLIRIGCNVQLAFEVQQTPLCDTADYDETQRLCLAIKPSDNVQSVITVAASSMRSCNLVPHVM